MKLNNFQWLRNKESNPARYKDSAGHPVAAEQTRQAGDLWILVSVELKRCLQYQKATKKARFALRRLRETLRPRRLKVLLQLFRAFVWPQVMLCFRAWTPHLEIDTNVLEQVQVELQADPDGQDTLDTSTSLKHSTFTPWKDVGREAA